MGAGGSKTPEESTVPSSSSQTALGTVPMDQTRVMHRTVFGSAALGSAMASARSFFGTTVVDEEAARRERLLGDVDRAIEESKEVDASSAEALREAKDKLGTAILNATDAGLEGDDLRGAGVRRRELQALIETAEASRRRTCSWFPCCATNAGQLQREEKENEVTADAFAEKARLDCRIQLLEEEIRVQQEQVQEQKRQLSGGAADSEEARLRQRIQALEEQVQRQQEQVREEKKTSSEKARLNKRLGALEEQVRRHQLEVREEAKSLGAVQQNSFCQLQARTKCRYKSASYGNWMAAVVKGFNKSDGTYDLDVKQHASIDKISPDPGVSQSEAWPAGMVVDYESNTTKQWVPAKILSYNESLRGEGTYNLDVREKASCDRIRPRSA